MDIQTAKLNVLQKIINLSEPALLSKISNILDEEMIIGYTTDGRPLNTKQYNEKLIEAETQIESGDYVSHDELNKEIANWR